MRHELPLLLRDVEEKLLEIDGASEVAAMFLPSSDDVPIIMPNERARAPRRLSRGLRRRLV